MKMPSLNIGELKASLPIIQGGMGIGVSLSSLAAAVSNAGGIGVISSAQIGFREKDFFSNPFEANIRALKEEIRKAREKCKDGILGVNIMVATKNYAEYVKAAIESGIDLIISGAGLPTHLPELSINSKVKIAPIVSSLKGAQVILKLWDKRHNVSPDLVVVEGPKAGGHLGFHKDDIERSEATFNTTITDIVNEVKKYEEKYNKEIPVIMAGGVFYGQDIKEALSLGAKGVQMATRFVATEECDASIEFKEAYVNAKSEDVVIVKSPVGMPGRALLNTFVKRTLEGPVKVTRCFNCLTPCNPADTPYCISLALMNAVNGDIDNGLIFCGSNVDKVNKITTVSKLMDTIETEFQN